MTTTDRVASTRIATVSRTETTDSSPVTVSRTIALTTDRAVSRVSRITVSATDSRVSRADSTVTTEISRAALTRTVTTAVPQKIRTTVLTESPLSPSPSQRSSRALRKREQVTFAL